MSLSDSITMTRAELAAMIGQAVAQAMASVLPAAPQTARSEQNRRAYEKRIKTAENAESAESPTESAESPTENAESPTENAESVATPSPSPPPLSPLHPPLPAPTPPPPGDIRVHEPQLFADIESGRRPMPRAVAAPLRALFSRLGSTAWTAKEMVAYRKLRLTESQMVSDIAAFARARALGWEWYRRDPEALLNNWQTEVDRTTDYLTKLTKTPSKNANNGRTNQSPHVSRNPAPLASGGTGLNATADNAPGKNDPGLGGQGRSGPDSDGKWRI